MSPASNNHSILQFDVGALINEYTDSLAIFFAQSPVADTGEALVIERSRELLRDSRVSFKYQADSV